jgi:hypothetical protein
MRTVAVLFHVKVPAVEITKEITDCMSVVITLAASQGNKRIVSLLK